MKFLIFGAGAIGTYIGGNLALSGHSVYFLEQEQNIPSLLEDGISILDEKGERRTKQIQAGAGLDEALKNGPYDVAILAVKSFDTDPLLESFQPYQNLIPPILCVQNGVENEDKIAQQLTASRVIHGTVTSAIGRRGLGAITVERKRGIGIGLGNPISEPLICVLKSAGFNVKGYQNGKAMKWSKMLTNLVANASSAILNMSPREIYENPASFEIEWRMVRETLQVMNHLGISVTNLPETPVVPLVFAFQKLPKPLARPFLARGVGSGRGGKMPSFHIDLYRGVPKSEVEFLNGAVVRFGEKLGIPTPVNQALTNTLLGMAAGKIDLRTYDHQPEKLLMELRS